MVRFAFVIEGKGEIAALPLLVRRICHDIYGDFSVQTSQPVRVTKSKALRPGELERAVRLALANTESQGPVVVVIDADEDCPAILGPSLKSRALTAAQPDRISVVVPKYEFETWFLTAAQSLAGKRGLRSNLSPPTDPGMIRGAKEWLNKHMVPGRKYSPTVDQAALVAGMNLHAARACRSFDRLCREVGRLIQP